MYVSFLFYFPDIRLLIKGKRSCFVENESILVISFLFDADL